MAPTLKEIEDYWNNIWGTTGHFNNSPEWLNVLEKEYCHKIQPEDYNINTDTLQTAIKNSTKSPGKDLIVGYWYKNFTFYRNDLAELYNDTFTGLIEILTWMAKAKLFFFLKMTKLIGIKTTEYNAETLHRLYKSVFARPL